ncbi:hypothetical protein GCM10029964_056270 [Kibdelosporangium lantanae]
MAFVVVLAIVVTIMTVVHWRRPGRNRVPDLGADGQDAECETVGRLFADDLGQAEYHVTMAELARGARGDVDVPAIAMLGHDLRPQMNLLGVALPQVPTDVLRAAIMLAHNGATADMLVRVLHLTRYQAVSVLVGSRRTRER